MANIKKIVYDVINIASGGSPRYVSQLSPKQVVHWVDYYRAKTIYDNYAKFHTLNPQLWQDLGCIELQEIDKSECEKKFGCIVKKAIIPAVIELPGFYPLFAGLIDKVTPIPVYPVSVVNYKRFNRFTGSMKRAYVIENSIYITGDIRIKFINVRGIFASPTEVTMDGKCFDQEKDIYPLSDDMVQIIMSNIIRLELTAFMRDMTQEIQFQLVGVKGGDTSKAEAAKAK